MEFGRVLEGIEGSRLSHGLLKRPAKPFGKPAEFQAFLVGRLVGTPIALIASTSLFDTFAFRARERPSDAEKCQVISMIFSHQR